MATAIDGNKTLERIVERLKTIDPYRIVLFGSMAGGAAREDSDIDIVVVTKDNFMPENYKQKSDLYLKVSTVLGDISRTMPIDLIVYTKPMFERFNTLGSAFSREVRSKGVVLYEADQSRMA